MDRSVFGEWWWTVDRRLLMAFSALIIFGVVLVSAASPPVAMRIGLNEYHFIFRHIIMLLPAVVMMIGLSMLRPRNLWRFCSLMLIGTIGALVFVILFGVEIKGAQRWIHLPGFSLQPSEFAKPAFAVSAAWLIARQKENKSFKGGLLSAGLFLMIITLLLLQPDLGMTFVVGCIYGAILFLAGMPLWIVGGMSVLGVVGIIGSYFAFSHVQSRIDRFLDPASGDSFQVQKSLEAFQNGGLFGTGPGQGSVKLGLPDAHADFIFAVSGEELGFLVTFLLVAIFMFILFRGFNRMMETQNMFVVLAMGGLLTMFGVQAFVHMGSSLSMIPTKGMTLPFISYGGSSLLSVSIAAGALLCLTRQNVRKNVARGSTVKRSKAKSVSLPVQGEL